MFAHLLLISITLFTSGVLSIPARLNTARAIALRPYWQCDVGSQYDSNSKQCKTCSRGTFSPAGIACYPSPAGFYNGQVGASDPSSCSPGTYTDVVGLSTCKQCTAPFTSSAASSSCDQCIDGTSAVNNPTCASSPTPSSTCSPGSAVDNTGKCTPCKVGSFSPDGANCYNSPTGFFNDQSGATDPKGCLPGTYTDIIGLAACKPCTGVLVSGAAATMCHVCSDGSSSTDGQTCNKCSAGSYSTGGKTCNLADPGSFVSTIGASTQTACLLGSFSISSGATTCTTCTAAGFPGKSSYSSTTGSYDCANCPDGSALDADLVGCTKCTPGYYSTGGVACIAAPAGNYVKISGATSYLPCNNGEFTITTGSTICSSCASTGSYGLISQSSIMKNCVPCPTKSYADADGAYCISCQAGSLNKACK